MNTHADFADRVVAWFDRAGRHDLPWQNSNDPYRVWVSEIMLQQTQVATVIPYYERFIARFPNLAALARSPIDDVLHHWTGLGYYARARNLHRAAVLISDNHNGVFPQHIDELTALPGIGRSTAGAILTLACGQRHPILDGNVKRVLARHRAVDGWPGRTAVERTLWALAAERVPVVRADAYTQAIMDLGATVCTRRQPACALCPVSADCRAHNAGTPEAYPQSRPKRALPHRTTRMLMIRDRQGRILLQRRAPTGLWGGLWSFPEVAAGADAVAESENRLGLRIELLDEWPVVAHGFSHYSLDIVPLAARVVGDAARVMESDDTIWYNPSHPDAVGLPAPIHRLLQQLLQTP